MKVYTKTGDDGSTALFGGDRVKKNYIRVEAYGSIDELNSFLGALISKTTDIDIQTYLQNIQHILFNIGSVIATVDPRFISKLPALLDSDIDSLEQRIDQMEQNLSAMTNFILPSGSEAIASAHICRTVCRRAERNLVSLIEIEGSNVGIDFSMKFLNRLSDYFFVLARKIAQIERREDTIWNKDIKL